MSNKDRKKRSARKARAAKRAAREEAQADGQSVNTKSDEVGSSAASAAPKSKAKPTKKEAKSKPQEKEKTKKQPGRIRSYFIAVRTEMHRVTWPSTIELRNYTLAVVVMLVIFGVCVWLVDTGFVAVIAGFTGLRG